MYMDRAFAPTKTFHMTNNNLEHYEHTRWFTGHQYDLTTISNNGHHSDQISKYS
jgi:hypothetical protein